MKKTHGLPWWLNGKASNCQCKRYGLDPWSGKIPHASEQVSPRAETTERCSRARALQQEKPLKRDADAQLESSLLLPQLEKALASTKTQHSQNK